MNKKLAHALFLFFDFLCLEGIWYGFHEFQRILTEIVIQADIIRFGNRVGFFLVAFGFLLIHFFIIIEHFRPSFIHKHERLMNQGAIAMVILLISAGFIGSSWIKTQVENAGYYYCREASGVGALSRTLVYTRDAAVCEDLAAAKNENRK